MAKCRLLLTYIGEVAIGAIVVSCLLMWVILYLTCYPVRHYRLPAKGCTNVPVPKPGPEYQV
jgi:hypothetical protein